MVEISGRAGGVVGTTSMIIRTRRVNRYEGRKLRALPPPCGEGRGGGREATRKRGWSRITSRPPPLTPPRKGEGNVHLTDRIVTAATQALPASHARCLF